AGPPAARPGGERRPLRAALADRR
ncbi:MAG: hypothetical protein AVDCRST_MAG48-800, partial [uncultured Friedmanniella sp.]